MIHLIQNICHYFEAEDGAVTIDWVMLVAATVGLGLVLVTNIAPKVEDKAAYIQGTIAKN